jgi:23S rRNA (pseudouridine1915-N3)-methyltransferase
MHIIIIWPGKTKNTHADYMIRDYCKKIEKMIRFQIIQIKENKYDTARKLRDEKKLIEDAIPPHSYIVVLDSKGTYAVTNDLLKLISTRIHGSAKNLVFVVGSHLGLHADIKAHAHLQVALSPLDLPHELCRIILVEQIYRVLCIMNTIPYPK